MAKLNFKKGTTSKLVHVFVQDATQTNGAGLAGLAYNSSGLTAYYFLEGATSAVQIALAAGSLGTWSNGGFVAVDGTNMPGLYEVGLPNAALTGANSVKVILKGAASMVVTLLEIQLDATDNQDAVRGGMTALPNANASASGGLLTYGNSTGQLNPTAGSVPVVSIPASALVGSGLVTYAGAVADGSSTTTVVDTSISTANGDLFSGQAIVFLSGPLAGKAAHVTSVTVYNTSFYQLNLSTTLPSAPGNGVQFALLPWSKALVLFASSLDSAGRVTTTYPIRVNTAFTNFTFSMVSSTDHMTPKTGASVTGQVSLNGGAFASLTNAVVEVGSGVYKVNLAAGDLNGADVFLRFTAGGADPVIIKLILNA